MNGKGYVYLKLDSPKSLIAIYKTVAIYIIGSIIELT